MQLRNAERIADALEAEGVDVEIYEDYSGRGMFGSQTAGVVVKDPGSVELIMSQLGIEDSQRRDNMGLSYIVY